MESKKRLIDANAADVERIPCYYGGHCRTEDVQEWLNEQPTVDAVEVVRCKNCKSCDLHYPEKQIDKEATPGWYCKEHKRYRKPDDFCSYGERKDNG